METIIKKKTKREFVIGNFRLVQPSVGKKEIWIFNRVSGESLALKEEIFEKVIRFLYKNNTPRTEEQLYGICLHK